MNEKQDVLKAILNVKKYAKNLKRNATSIQEINFDNDHLIDEVASSPSFFEGKRDTNPDEIGSPLLFHKSSFRETHSKHDGNQKKDFSMTILPKKKDIMEREETKYRNADHIQQGSRNSSINKSTRSQQLAQSQKYEYLPSTQLKSQLTIKQIKESKNRSFQKKVTKQEQKQSVVENKSVFEYYSPKRQGYFSLHKEVDGTHPAVIENPELIEELISQIQYLKEQLVHYKSALLLVKDRYFEMQDKANQKAQIDNMVDILKQEVNEMGNQNERLTQVIEKQNQQIRNFENSMAEVSEKIMNFYKSQTETLVKLQTQNQFLVHLTDLKTIIDLKSAIENDNKKSSVEKSQKNSETSPFSDSESESEGNFEPIAQFCKNQNDLKVKYGASSLPS